MAKVPSAGVWICWPPGRIRRVAARGPAAESIRPRTWPVVAAGGAASSSVGAGRAGQGTWGSMAPPREALGTPSPSASSSPSPTPSPSVSASVGLVPQLCCSHSSARPSLSWSALGRAGAVSTRPPCSEPPPPHAARPSPTLEIARRARSVGRGSEASLGLPRGSPTTPRRTRACPTARRAGRRRPGSPGSRTCASRPRP